MSSLISADQMAEWRALRGEGMVSAVGEYTPEEFWRALDAIDALAADNKRLQAECQMLRGLTPEAPPRPPEGEGLPRFGLRWNGPGQPVSVPMDDGYWTPWHLAKSAADHSADAPPLVLDECLRGIYAVRYRDNWDGQGDIYHAIAEKTARGEWVHNDSGTRLLQFEGDAILAAWLLTAAPAPSAGGVA
ncbi:MAG: hypothetical protein KKD30_02285 [Gammaproteobacteria bacterium]|uniref:Uncharacterized protein n=1 Tax=viral metagenome TaxID=1070528 RepID=A0A6M3MAA6_9ZZZZ|nr:hypothetical protein [Gammaproteobacteria bacterium]MBU0883269.1 hypothetical protein [Gammaproteobacteria bacterium]MBU1858778.1 hypothetical protein [Gammaproteobacteria bacterium]